MVRSKFGGRKPRRSGCHPCFASASSMLAFVPPLTKAGYVHLEATTSEACLDRRKLIRCNKSDRPTNGILARGPMTQKTAHGVLSTVPDLGSFVRRIFAGALLCFFTFNMPTRRRRDNLSAGILPMPVLDLLDCLGTGRWCVRRHQLRSRHDDLSLRTSIGQL